MLANQGHRPVGVKIPDGQLHDRSDKADLTVEHLIPMEFFGAQYVENGKLKAGLFVQSGGRFYLAPNGEQWISGMRELSEALTNNVRVIYDRIKGGPLKDVPLEDTVDIIAQATVAEVPPNDVDILPGA
jgi:hypothetical protein